MKQNDSRIPSDAVFVCLDALTEQRSTEEDEACYARENSELDSRYFFAAAGSRGGCHRNI